MRIYTNIGPMDPLPPWLAGVKRLSRARLRAHCPGPYVYCIVFSVERSIVLYCICFIVLYCIALHCFVLYCLVLYCIVLYCFVFSAERSIVL